MTTKHHNRSKQDTFLHLCNLIADPPERDSEDQLDQLVETTFGARRSHKPRIELHEPAPDEELNFD